MVRELFLLSNQQNQNRILRKMMSPLNLLSRQLCSSGVTTILSIYFIVALTLASSSRQDELFIGTIEATELSNNSITNRIQPLGNGEKNNDNNKVEISTDSHHDNELTDSSCKHALDEINSNVRSMLDTMRSLHHQHDQQLQTLAANMRSSDHKLDKIVLMLAQMQLSAAETSIHQSGNSLLSTVESDIQVGLQSASKDKNLAKPSYGGGAASAAREKRTSIELAGLSMNGDNGEQIVSGANSTILTTSLDNDNSDNIDSKRTTATTTTTLEKDWAQNNNKHQHKLLSTILLDSGADSRNSIEEDSGGVSLIMEQLTSMRNQLNKLLNREVDHTYQYNSIAEQLIELKDECSTLFASMQMVMNDAAAGTLVRRDNFTSDGGGGQLIKRTAEITESQFGGTTLKSSDVSAIAKMLNKQIELDNNTNNKASDTNVSMVASNQSNADFKMSRLDTSQQQQQHHYDVKRQLTEINSIVKHVAQLINRRQLECKSPVYFDSSTSVADLSPETTSPHNNYSTLATTMINDSSSSSGQLDKKSSKLPTRWYGDNGQLIKELAFDSHQHQHQQQHSHSSIAPTIVSSIVDKKHSSSSLTSTASSNGSSIPAGVKPAIDHHHTNNKCNPTSLVAPKSCMHLKKSGANCSGQYYTIKRHNVHRVYCDMEDRGDGGGWTVILRRIDKTRAPTLVAGQHHSLRTTNQNDQNDKTIHFNEVSLKDRRRNYQQQLANSAGQLIARQQAVKVGFDQDWDSYKYGFGHMDGEWGEFWLGLDLISLLTTSDKTEAKLELESNIGGELLSLHYDSFRVSNESDNYRLHIGQCNDTKGQLFEYHNQSQFWTLDHSPPLTTRRSYDTTTHKRQLNSSASVVIAPSSGSQEKSIELVHYDNHSPSLTNHNNNKQTSEDLFGCSKMVDGAGWWFVAPSVSPDQTRANSSSKSCYRVLLTASTPLVEDDVDELTNLVSDQNGDKSERVKSRKGLFWPSWKGSEPLYRMTLKIRQKLN